MPRVAPLGKLPAYDLWCPVHGIGTPGNFLMEGLRYCGALVGENKRCNHRVYLQTAALVTNIASFANLKGTLSRDTDVLVGLDGGPLDPDPEDVILSDLVSDVLLEQGLDECQAR